MNKPGFVIFICLMLFFVRITSGQEEREWKLRKQKNGIEVYSKDADGSSFESFRAKTTFSCSIQTFVAALQDVEALPEWGYNVRSIKVLKEQGDTLQIYYSQATAPFPFSDRDGIYQNLYRWQKEKQILSVEIKILSGYLPENNGLVRVKGEGFWQVKVCDDGKLDIVFQMQVDPGGSIPAWLANLFTDETPYQSLFNFRELIKKEKYQDQYFDFLK
jgi:hypothetical protein